MKNNKHPLTLDEFNYFYKKVPRFCAEVVVKTPKGIVLTKRAIEPGKGTWHLPGGTVLNNETLAQAASRVTKEELGIDVAVGKQLGILEYVNTENAKDITAFGVIYLASTQSTEFTLDFQATEYGFFQDIPDNTFKEHEDFLNAHKSDIFD